MLTNRRIVKYFSSEHSKCTELETEKCLNLQYTYSSSDHDFFCQISFSGLNIETYPLGPERRLTAF